MRIVTGYRATPHISSNDIQGFNQGVVGTGNYVFNVGTKFDANLTDVNTVTIADGEGVLQGAHFRIDPGESETVNIANGTTGMNRKDLICARYTKNATTGIEDVQLVVIQGEESSSTATEPDYNTGDILDGDTPIDFPLYRVDLSGLTPTLVKLFMIKNPIPKIQAGQITGGSVSPGNHEDWEVTFDEAFSSTPYVVVGFITNATEGAFGKCSCAAVLSSVSKTGFTLRVYNGDTSNRSPKCNWFAVV